MKKLRWEKPKELTFSDPPDQLVVAAWVQLVSAP